MNEAVQHFLQARGIVNHLHEAIDRGKGWFRFEFVHKDPRMERTMESDWLETGFMDFHWSAWRLSLSMACWNQLQTDQGADFLDGLGSTSRSL